MSVKTLVAAGAVALVSLPAIAGDMGIMIKDAYARSGPKSGAVFFTIMNHSEAEDRLMGAATDVAPRVELHTHIVENDIAKMVELEDGIAVPAGGMHALARGGDHVMLMGLDGMLKQDSTITVTLQFEQAGDVVVEVPVDNKRRPVASGHGHTGHTNN